MRMRYFEDDGYSRHVELRMKEAEAIKRDFYQKAPVDRIKAHLRYKLTRSPEKAPRTELK